MSVVLAKRAIAAAGYYPAFKRARTVGTMARMAYNNRRTLYRAARTIGRSYRRYRRRKQIFRPPNPSVGSANCKRANINTGGGGAQNFNDVTLNVFDNLCRITHTSSNDADGRQRNLINVRGFKICIEVQNVTATPLYWNVAIIIPRQTTAVSTIDFFRANTQERSNNFDPVIMSGLEFHCTPINSDKHVVLMHKRFRLNKSDLGVSAFDSQQGRSFLNLDFYKKFNKQVRYNRESEDQPDAGTPFLVHWASGWGTGTGETPTTSYTANIRAITYFRETK